MIIPAPNILGYIPGQLMGFSIRWYTSCNDIPIEDSSRTDVSNAYIDLCIGCTVVSKGGISGYGINFYQN